MFRKLLIVFASGVILSIVAFSAAWLVGGEKLHKLVRDDTFEWNMGDNEDRGPRIARNFAIAPGAHIAMDVPVQLTFVRGDKAEMVVKGPKTVVDRLTWENGRLGIEGDWHNRKGVEVRITAPHIDGMDFDAPGDVTLTGLDQDSLTLNSDSAINLEATGKLRALTIKAHGAGSLDFEKVELRDASIRMDGAGNVIIGATGNVDAVINGVGNIRLVRKPAHIDSQINGIGNVDHDYQ